MKQFLLAAALSFACVSANAESALSCEEIDQVGESLTALGIAMDDENMAVGEDSPEDTALAEVVVGLADIAEAEGDEDLANASVGMADAWHAMDRDAFTDALADAVAKLAVVSAAECP